MNVLLIEDDGTDAALFLKQIEVADPQADVTIEETLEGGATRCAAESFDVVVLDLDLPDSRGLGTLDSFLEDIASPPAVVLLTGLDDRDLGMRAVQAGAQDFVVKGMMRGAALIQILRNAIERHRMAERLMAANDRVRYLATHCSLTELPNRYLFLDRLENAIASCERMQEGLAVLFIDLNRFKPINDTFGHEAGDEVLRVIAERLRKTTRSSDTVARLGGDEFTILLKNLDDPLRIERLVDKIVGAISEPISFEEAEVCVSASVGVGIYPVDGSTASSLLANADAAMYHAKRRGVSQYLWSDQLRRETRGRLALEQDLAAALAQERIVLHYQPQLDVPANQIVGFEALCRWNRVRHGPISPLDLLSVAEESDLIDRFGQVTFQEALRAQARLAKASSRPIRICVNASAKQVWRPGFATTLADLIEESDVPARTLVVEIPEGCFSKAHGALEAKLALLSKSGIGIAIDDFGSEFCPLGRLDTLSLDSIKISPRLVHTAPTQDRSAALVRSIIHLGREMGIQIVAKHVETEQQMAFLVENGCQLMQGHLFAGALPEAQAYRAAESNDLPSWARVNQTRANVRQRSLPTES